MASCSKPSSAPRLQAAQVGRPTGGPQARPPGRLLSRDCPGSSGPRLTGFKPKASRLGHVMPQLQCIFQFVPQSLVNPILWPQWAHGRDMSYTEQDNVASCPRPRSALLHWERWEVRTNLLLLGGVEWFSSIYTSSNFLHIVDAQINPYWMSELVILKVKEHI